MRTYLRGVLFLFLVTASSVDGFAQGTEVVYWGEARDEEGRLVYREKHITHYVDGKTRKSLTLYLDPTGREIAMMESDYDRSLALPTYVFKDYRRDYEEGLRFRDGTYLIFNKDSERGEEEKVLKDPRNVFSCQGWHYYVVENLGKLERGDVFELKLIFPNKLRSYNFKIEKVRSEGDTIRVKVRFATWVVSWFVPHLDLVYSKKERKLIEYRGVSNIFDANDDLQEVRITYTDVPLSSPEASP